MGGTMRSPFTGMVFALELTHDFNALPVLFIGSMAALGVTVLVLRRSILTEKLARRGQHIAREYSVDLFELIRVGDVMDREVPIVPAEMTVKELSEQITKGDPAVSKRQVSFIVTANQRLAGIITRADMMRALLKEPAGTMTVLAAGKSNPILAYADEPLQDAVARMLKHKIGRLPVVMKNETGRAIGYLGRADILAARTRYYEEEESRSRGLSLSQAT
jgi:chloride channel protein, CIC family